VDRGAPPVRQDVDEAGSARREYPRVLGDAGGPSGGPLLVCLGGLHGNEPCGVLALQRVFARLAEDATGLAGRLIGLAGNRPALAAGERFLDEDLNRIWLPAALDPNAPEPANPSSELTELRGIASELEVLRASPNGRAFLLDLHSTSGGGASFTSLDDTLANRALAFELPVPHVLGLEEELAGTLVSWLNELGIPAIGFESGQHDDPGSVDRAEAAIWVSMETTGVVERGTREEVARALILLEQEHRDAPDVVEVLHRHAVESGDGFVMQPGYVNFQDVDEGELLARDAGGPLHAQRSAKILMPLYQGLGEDGYFLVRSVPAMWLALSARLRRLRADRLLHWLPGVRRDPDRPQTFVVDLRRARVLALQVFHLLGYRRVERNEHSLVMRRRDARPS